LLDPGSDCQVQVFDLLTIAIPEAYQQSALQEIVIEDQSQLY